MWLRTYICTYERGELLEITVVIQQLLMNRCRSRPRPRRGRDKCITNEILGKDQIWECMFEKH
jgi:hypothetical protein